MGVYSAREIYRFARLAGFSPDQATTMTAIALAESGGDSRAHNTSGEDSRGLWQINVPQHGDWAARRDMYDPVENARAAFKISGGGKDVSPWTTTHGGARARYLGYRAEAEAAARACGDGTGLGVWSGTVGYHHPLSAGHDGAGAPVGGVDAGAGAPAGGGDPGRLRTFVDSALAQSGDPYVFGASARSDDPNPKSFDCSELVRWSAHRAGVDLPRRAFDQYMQLEHQGATLSVEEALHTPGALLFSFKTAPPAVGRSDEEHVAISLGDGRTIEARGGSYGVGSWPAKGRFGYAAVIPGVSGGQGGGATMAASLALAGGGTGIDSDHDGLTDDLEIKLGLDPKAADTDQDGLSDGYEMLQLHTDPHRADTDGDGVTDSVELALGTDPNDPDTNRDGRLDGAESRPDGAVDTDGDGLTDELEKLLRTNPQSMDSDGDGFADGAEYQAFFDPANPTSNPLAGPGGPGPSGGSSTGLTRAASTPPADPHSWGLDHLDPPTT